MLSETYLDYKISRVRSDSEYDDVNVTRKGKVVIYFKVNVITPNDLIMDRIKGIIDRGFIK